MNLVPGDLVLVDLGTAPYGHEQSGARPAIFVSRTESMSLVIPLTTNLRAKRFDATHCVTVNATNKLDTDSVALIFQLRAIDSRRIVHRIGKLSAKDIRAVNTILREIAVIAKE